MSVVACNRFILKILILDEETKHYPINQKVRRINGGGEKIRHLKRYNGTEMSNSLALTFEVQFRCNNS